MSLILTANGAFQRVDFEKESDLENAILEVRRHLLGKKG